MDVNRIISELDTEIARLQKIRAALTGLGEVSTAAPVKGKRGRPKGSKNLGTAAATTAVAEKTVAKSVAKKAPGKRQLTPEGRKRIADAMKRRWAAHRKTTK